jgi:hypothetical protein
MRDNSVMLSVAKYLETQRERPFAAAQGDIVSHLRLMPNRADKSAMGAINRPLRLVGLQFFRASATIWALTCPCLSTTIGKRKEKSRWLRG